MLIMVIDVSLMDIVNKCQYLGIMLRYWMLIIIIVVILMWMLNVESLLLMVIVNKC